MNKIFLLLLISSSCLANLPGDEEGHDGIIDRDNFDCPYDDKGLPIFNKSNNR